MKLTKFIYLMLLSLVLLLNGCGGKGVTGTLTMTQPTVTNNTTFSQVSVTISYSNPNVTSVGNVVVSVSATGYGTTEYTLNDNGTNTSTITLTFLAPRDPTIETTFSIAATTGDLVASVVAVIPAQSTTTTALTANPTSITFLSTEGIGTTHTVAISGGTTPYLTPLVSPTPNSNISASIVGTTLTITRNSTATGSASVVVLDSASPTGSVIIPVTLQ